MHIFLSNLIVLFKRLSVILIGYFLCRIYFSAFHFQLLLPFCGTDTILVLINGLKFDLSSLLFTNAVFVLLHLLPLPIAGSAKYQQWLSILMVAANSVFLTLNIIDTGYFSFQNARSSADFVSNLLFSADTVSLLPHYLWDYWYHTLASLVLCVGLWVCFPKYNHIEHRERPSAFRSVLVVSLLSIFVLAITLAGIRGVAAKPLRIVDASVNTASKYAPIVLNSVFTVIKTIGKKGVVPAEYFSADSASAIFTAFKAPAKPARSSAPKKNVVLLILESISNEVIGELNGVLPTNTPFIDSLVRSGLVFENMFSNGRTSIQAVPSVLVSLPQLMDVSLITSQYAANAVTSIPSVLREYGYTSSFFHGAFNGSMGFDKYCSAIGFDHYYGQDEYLEVHSGQDAECSWGIFDDKFLLFAAEELDRSRQPFFASIFTISSHHPYELPRRYAHFRDSAPPDLAAVRYADCALRLFFEDIRNSSWYPNTIFILVADHVAPYSSAGKVGQAPSADSSATPSFDLNALRIPLVIFDPSSDSLAIRSSRVVQQLDIMPSLFHLLGVDKPHVSFGNDFFSPASAQFAFSYNQGIYTYIDSACVIQFDGLQVINIDNRLKDTPVSANALGDKTDFIRAYIQDYSHRMVFNDLR